MSLSALTAGGESGETAKFTPPETPYNGAFTRSIPIEVPAFFGIEPKLALEYNSGDTRLRANDGFSPIAVGWRLAGGSAINRASSKGGTPLFDSTDQFVLDGNRLLPCASAPDTPSCSAGGTHMGRFETYNRISQVSSGISGYWQVTGRDGTVLTYRPVGYWDVGGAQDARLREDYRWLLSEVRDTSGNAVTYGYDCTGLPSCVVSQISYGAGAGAAVISLVWDSRPDTVSYATGLSVASTSKRLRTVAVQVGGAYARGYALAYTTSPDTKRSLLASVQQYGSNLTMAGGLITGGTAYPAETFSYWDMASRRLGTMISDRPTPDANPETTPSTTATEPQSYLATNPVTNANYVVADFNGDGKSDLIVTKEGTGCQARFYASGRWTASGTAPSGGPLLADPNGLAPIGFCTAGTEWQVGDFNGDGKADLATTTTLAGLTATARQPWTSQGYATSDAAVAVVLLDGETIIGGFATPAVAPGAGSNWGIRSTTQAQKLIVADFNGDGLADAYRGNVLISTGTSLERQSWANADWGRVGDFNGDGLADLFVLDGVNGTASRLLLSTGSGFTTSSLGGAAITNRGNYHWPEFENPTIQYSYTATESPPYKLVGNPKFYWKTYYNNAGTNWQGLAVWNDTIVWSTNLPNEYYSPSVSVGGYTYHRGAERENIDHNNVFYEIYRTWTQSVSENAYSRLGGWGIADINGDGLSDIVQVREASGVKSLYGWYANGANVQKTTLAANLASSSVWNQFPFSLIDLNGDGKAEFVQPATGNDGYYVASFNGTALGANTYYRPAPGGATALGLADFNGDGKLDLAQAFAAAPSGCASCVAAAADSVMPDTMKRHGLSSGGSVDIEYLPSTYASDNGYMPLILQTVSKITTSDGRGNASAVKYAYAEGAYDAFEQKFLGFRTVTAELPCEAHETACPWIEATYRQEAVAAGSLARMDIHAGDGTLLRRLENGYTVNQTSAPFTAHKTSEEVTDYLVGGATTTRKEWTYDGYANLLEEKDLGKLGWTGDDVITTSSYQINLTDYLVNLPKQVTVADAGNTVLRDTQFYYDGATAISEPPVKGLATTTRKWLGGSENRWLESTASYDSFGQLVATTDPLGNRTEKSYDAITHQYVIEERNPLYLLGDARQKTQGTWNLLCGQPATSTDANGQVTTYQYDALCRQIRIDYPSGSYRTTTYNAIGNPTAQNIEQFNYLGTGPAQASEIVVNLASGGSAITLESLFNPSDWTGQTAKRVILPAGVERGNATTTDAAVSIGATAWGGALTFDILGTISGKGGAANGGNGGHAFNANRLGDQGQKITVNNDGIVRGGGGGGAKGGNGGGGSYPNYQNTGWQPYARYGFNWEVTPSGTMNRIFWNGSNLGDYAGSGLNTVSINGWTYIRGTQAESYSGYGGYRISRQRVTPVTTSTNGGAGGNGGKGQGYEGPAGSGSAGSAGGTNAGTGGAGGAGGSWGQAGDTGTAGTNGNASAGAASTPGGQAGVGFQNTSNAVINIGVPNDNSPELAVNLPAGNTSITLESLFSPAEWASGTSKRVVLPANAERGNGANLDAAVSIGATAWGGRLTFDILGTISGKGGAANGGNGGNAFDANRLGDQGQKIIVNNGGIVRAGGGGGGKGGGGGTGSVSTPYTEYWPTNGSYRGDGNTSSGGHYWGVSTGNSNRISIALDSIQGRIELTSNPGATYTHSDGWTYQKGPTQFLTYGGWYLWSVRKYRASTTTSYANGGAGGDGGRGQGFDGSASAGTSGVAGGTNAGSGGVGGTGGSFGANGGVGSVGANGNAGSGVAGGAGGLAGLAFQNPSNIDLRVGVPVRTLIEKSADHRLTRTLLDGLGRVYRSEDVSADGVRVTASVFDKRGLTAQSSAPYFATGTPVWTSTRFDVLGRPVLVTYPDASTLILSYALPTAAGATLAVLSTDALGRISRIETDARGNPLLRQGPGAGSSDSVVASFSPLGEQLTVEDALGNHWSSTFDTLGRKAASTDPDLGTWTYAYYDGGRMTGQIDAMGQATSFSYDALGRLVTRTAGLGLPGQFSVTNT